MPGYFCQFEEDLSQAWGQLCWEYLTDRVYGKNVIPPLGELIAQKVQSLGTLAEPISLSLA
jgi:hypothetical protein